MQSGKRDVKDLGFSKEAFEEYCEWMKIYEPETLGRLQIETILAYKIGLLEEHALYYANNVEQLKKDMLS